MNRQKASTNTIAVENNQTSFSLPNRTTGLVNPSAGHGRRLSLVQELTKSINPESSFSNGDINTNILNNDEPETNAGAKPWKRPSRISTTVINEEDEESRDEELPIDPGTEEANVGFYRNQNKQEQEREQQSVDVIELRNQLTGDISELKTKLSRVENQLAFVIHLMQNKNPDLSLRHSQSFPTPTLRSSPSQDSRKDHTVSAVNNVDAKDSENADSPSWLSPTPGRNKRSISDPNHRKQSGKSLRDRNSETESPIVNVARHGRRKISDS